MSDEETAPARRRPAGRRGFLVRTLLGVLVLAAIAGAILLLHGPGVRFGSANGSGPLDSRAPALGQPAPNFALRDLSGRLVRLSDLRGKVVLVNFWATWCAPCREELPAIDQVYQAQHGQGLAVLEVDDGESAGDVAAYARRLGGLPPVLLDPNGAVVAQYRLQGLPDSFFVDRQGIVRARSYGPMAPRTILKNIETARGQ